ncbi:unnamed protein product [Protopolystoma xenopodis]|uniref:Uncharacterized protein n=1 Tax=Protopolystoma xenopodis TaxID=117903 RepID=A0A3S5C8S3_9PLAT|nr:unnamed protein product [Protopolystoma xenopodis]
MQITGRNHKITNLVSVTSFSVPIAFFPAVGVGRAVVLIVTIVTASTASFTIYFNVFSSPVFQTSADWPELCSSEKPQPSGVSASRQATESIWAEMTGS